MINSEVNGRKKSRRRKAVARVPPPLLFSFGYIFRVDSHQRITEVAALRVTFFDVAAIKKKRAPRCRGARQSTAHSKVLYLSVLVWNEKPFVSLSA
jgi:hypothetical protein